MTTRPRENRSLLPMDPPSAQSAMLPTATSA
jgi:hypothetical protein